MASDTDTPNPNLDPIQNNCKYGYVLPDRCRYMRHKGCVCGAYPPIKRFDTVNAPISELAQRAVHPKALEAADVLDGPEQECYPLCGCNRPDCARCSEQWKADNKRRGNYENRILNNE